MQNELSTQRALSPTRWRTYLQWITAVVAVDIALHSFIAKDPTMTLIAAGLWIGAGVVWTHRGGIGGPLVVGVLGLLELVASLFFSGELADEGSFTGWIAGVHYVLVVTALFVVVMTIVSERSTR